jgi:hypothetical protein
MKRLVVTFIVVILLLGISFGVLSATITVPDDYPSIQAAIDAVGPAAHTETMRVCRQRSVPVVALRSEGLWSASW